jgi:hypothetical protein
MDNENVTTICTRTSRCGVLYFLAAVRKRSASQQTPLVLPQRLTLHHPHIQSSVRSRGSVNTFFVINWWTIKPSSWVFWIYRGHSKIPSVSNKVWRHTNGTAESQPPHKVGQTRRLPPNKQDNNRSSVLSLWYDPAAPTYERLDTAPWSPNPLHSWHSNGYTITTEGTEEKRSNNEKTTYETKQEQSSNFEVAIFSFLVLQCCITSTSIARATD